MKKIIFGLFIAMAMISCVKEEFSEADSSLKSLSANVENDIDTKVGFTDGEAAFFWTKGDQIGVTTTQSSASFSLMNLDDEDAGKSSGSFTGSMAGNPQGYAVYPYISDKHSMSGNILTYHMPSEYTYSKLDGTYANPVGNSHNAPMYGIIDNGNVAFKHLGGVIAFQINELQENTAYTFKLTADKQISGDFDVDLTAQTPQLVASVTDNASEKSVSVSFTTSEDQTSGYIYMPIPTGTFESLNIKVYQGGTEIVNTTLTNKTINRKAIIRTTIGEQSLEGGEVNEVSSVEDVTKVLESVSESTDNVTVEVTEEVSGDQAIEIPAELETETTTIKFNEVANDATITINNENNGAYAGQIIIEIPAEATIPVIEANVPEGEVYIKQGNVTSLVVSSKENTTIIGAGVTVGTLTVKKGNVRIQEGGVVEEICRSENSDAKTYVYMAEGVTVPTIEDEDIIAMYMSEDAILVSTVDQLKDAVAYAEKPVKLLKDLTLSDILVINQSIILDGNSKTLTSTAGRAINVETEGDVVIKNLTINAGERAINIINKPANVTVDNVTATANNNAVMMATSATGSNLTVNQSDFTGLATVNVASANSKVEINYTKITNCDENKGENYGAITVFKTATNSTVVVNGGTVVVTDDSVAASIGAQGATVTFNGTEGAEKVQTVVAYIGDAGYTTLDEAVEDAEAGVTITLDRDITIDHLIEINKAITLDLNGKTVSTALQEEDRHYYAFDNNGTLTIKDTAGKGKIVARGINNYGTLTLESGTIEACDGNGGYALYNKAGSKFIMNGGSVVTTNEDDHMVDEGGYDATTIRVEPGAEAEIYGGEVNNICDYTFALDNYGETTIYGGTFTSIHTTIGNNGNLTIEGGSFKCNGLEGISAHVLWANGGEATINDGTFDGKDNFNGFNVYASKDATVNINGGKFLSVHSGSLYGEGTIVVAGGEFFDEVPAERLADGYQAVQSGDKWIVNKMQ